MTRVFTVFSIFFIFLGFSCKDLSPQPSAFVGKYRVTVDLDSKLDEHSIQDSIKNAMEKMKEELNVAKNKLKDELNQSDMDTTTLEGKLNYLANKLGNASADIGLELGGSFADVFSKLAESSIHLSKNVLKNLDIEVELQADGDIKTASKFGNFGIGDKKWSVSGSEFILTDQNQDKDQNKDQDEQRFNILDGGKDGFTLENDDLKINFKKINEKQ